MEAATLSEARVYVGTYGKYNNGSLFGSWLDLSDYSDKEDFYEACREIHKDEEDAEYSLGGCHYDRHWTYDEGAGSISLIFPNDADGGELIIDDQSFNRHLNLVFCDTLHVHDLQHALRLCGLDELADNFKV